SADQMKQVAAYTDMMLHETALGAPISPIMFRELRDVVGDGSQQAVEVVNALAKQLAALGDTENPPPVVSIVTTDPSHFAADLLRPTNVQARDSASLGRTLAEAFQRGADLAPQLTIQFAPTLRDSYYRAWANASVSPAIPTLSAVYALRVLATRFGAAAS